MLSENSHDGYQPSCSICTHAKRVAIEIELLRSSLRRTATAFGVSKSALQRHRDGHMIAALAAASDARRAGWSLSSARVHESFARLQADTLDFFAANVGVDNPIAVKALAILTRQILFAMRVSASAAPPSVGPDAFQLIGHALIEILAPHPEIRARVAAALLDVETRLGWVKPETGAENAGRY